jgi:hypothetical protein
LNNREIKLAINNDGDEAIDEGVNWINRGEFSLGLGDTYNKVLADISREHCEQTVVKVEDADIPKYPWEEHLLEEIETQKWDATKLAIIQRISNLSRSKMLCWRKQNVAVSYIQQPQPQPQQQNYCC